jgi:hypothetical protein
MHNRRGVYGIGLCLGMTKEEVYLINRVVRMGALNLFWGVQNLSKLIAFKCNR